MRVRYTHEALRRLAGIRLFIAIDSPVAADAIVRAIIERAESLSAFPRRGRVVPEYAQDDLRELLVHPYRILYRVGLDEVLVLSVMHGHQLLPGDLSAE